MRFEAFGSLRLHRGPFLDATHRAAHEALLRNVLELGPEAVTDETWTPFALFDSAGACVANVEATVLSLVLDGCQTKAAAIRSVAVARSWRGRGLFRALMDEALAFCDARTVGPTLLYTADPGLYGRFGFRSLLQHAFVGPAPAEASKSIGRHLDLSRHRDRSLIAKIIEARTPVSRQVALEVSPSLALTNLAKDGAPTIVHLADADALIMFEEDRDTLVVADVMASAIPPLGVLLASLSGRPRRIKTLFPPDRLGWTGDPVREETGLMIRGAIPAAMDRPFMFPPTTEF